MSARCAGAVLGFALNFLAAENTAPAPWLRFAVKRFMEFCRTVPDIVFALIFVIAFGLGPMAGVLAIAIHCVGALGKQYLEIVENIDMKPVEGVRSTGASWISCMRFAVLPQVVAGFASYTLLRFEINVRGASVMGFVGAGGIGQELVVAIRKFYYSDVSAILLMIVAHRLCHRYRHRMDTRAAVRQGPSRMSKLPTPDLEGSARAISRSFRTGRYPRGLRCRRCCLARSRFSCSAWFISSSRRRGCCRASASSAGSR